VIRFGSLAFNDQESSFRENVRVFEIDAPVSIKPEGTWRHLAPLKHAIESLRMNTKMSRGFANVYQSVFQSQECLSCLNSSWMRQFTRQNNRSRFRAFAPRFDSIDFFLDR